jgi:putative membrane protein
MADLDPRRATGRSRSVASLLAYHHSHEGVPMLKSTVYLVLAAFVAPMARAQAPALVSSHSPARAAVAALDDPTIVAIFDAANSWDMETGQLALEKSRNQDVRHFAEMMVRDHEAVRRLGRDLAQKLHVTPTPPGKDFALAVDHEKKMKLLRSATGRAFDKAYIDHEAWYHQAVIDAVTSQLLPATKNAELKALEEKVAPNFVAHLAAAKDLRQKLQR